jgi:hypothetical protein
MKYREIITRWHRKGFRRSKRRGDRHTPLRRLGWLTTILILAATTTALFSSGIQAEAEVQPGDPGRVTVLASSDKGITLALETPDFTTQPSHDASGSCLQIEAPGYIPESAVGAPRLPVQSTLVGIPHGVSVDL